MGGSERDHVAPLGDKVVADLVKIDVAATNAEKVLALGDGLSIRQNIVEQVNKIIDKSTS